jgi:hypothetical protein
MSRRQSHTVLQRFTGERMHQPNPCKCQRDYTSRLMSRQAVTSTMLLLRKVLLALLTIQVFQS